ncbi:MAG: GNAT family N-acetyltransferase [Terriglobia bacterium]
MTTHAFIFDPLRDPRWPQFLNLHSQASIFHTREWLQALQRTYDYPPVAFTTSSPGGPLENAIVFCRVESWLTGSRLVSLPFSDHCQLLVEHRDDWAILVAEMQQQVAAKKCGYVELRPPISNQDRLAGLAPFKKSEEYHLHKLDLRPDLRAIFRNFHESCIQRKIQRAGRENLTYEAGRSETTLAKFYHLLLLTRRRHQLLPQPVAWFRNLIGSLGENLTIHVASKGDQPIASILTLRYKKTIVYKYGASDANAHPLGGMPFLFWRAIESAKQWDAQEFDLGRSEVENPGLMKFKERLGAVGCKVSYLTLCLPRFHSFRKRPRLRLAGGAFARMPDSLARIAGSVLYKHVG